MLPTMSKSPGIEPTHRGYDPTGATGAFASALARLHAPASKTGPYGYDCVPSAEHALIHTLCAEFVKLTNGTAPPSNVPHNAFPDHAQNASAWHQLRSAIGLRSFDVPGIPPPGTNEPLKEHSGGCAYVPPSSESKKARYCATVTSVESMHVFGSTLTIVGPRPEGHEG